MLPCGIRFLLIVYIVIFSSSRIVDGQARPFVTSPNILFSTPFEFQFPNVTKAPPRPTFQNATKASIKLPFQNATKASIKLPLQNATEAPHLESTSESFDEATKSTEETVFSTSPAQTTEASTGKALITESSTGETSTTELPLTRPPIIEIPNGTVLPNQSIFKETVPIPKENVKIFMEGAVKADDVVKEFEAEMVKRGRLGAFTNGSTPSALHQSLMTGTEKQERISIDALAIQSVTQFMVKVSATNVSRAPARSRMIVSRLNGIENVRLVETEFGRRRCLDYPTCDINSFYRTFDGSCNNPINKMIGMAGTPVIRLLPSQYQDGLFMPRELSDIDGSPLPCARDVSQAVAPHIDRPESVQTLMTMQWGQFIDHDIILSPTSKVFSYGGAICCNPIVFIGNNGAGVPQFIEQQLPPFFFHPECFPICIDAGDPFFSQFGKTCMDFVRTQSAPNIHCTMGPREQMNALSHFIDGSMIYASDDARAQILRDPTGGGRLLSQGSGLLPEEQSNECPLDCFKAGDIRANEQVGLAFTHTMWVREHNRLAKHFYDDLNLDDEEAFQKARRIVIAEIQHITYNEFLRVILGKDYLEQNGIFTTPLGQYYTEYNEFLDASIANVFGAAAYRFGHSMIQNVIKLVNEDNEEEECLEFQGQVFNPGRLHNDSFFSSIARGLIAQGSQICDAFLVEDVKNHLFQKAHEFFGLDLLALNVQRGRDHGLPPYVKFREEFCNLPPINDFEDLHLPHEILARVMSVYNNVRDIDVFVGMLLEQPVYASILGPTFKCIIGNQFLRLKKGDRYFYDNDKQPFPFTPEELDEIKTRVTLSRVLCDNVDDIENIQPWAFYKPNMVWNKRKPCSEIPPLDLQVFN